MDEYRVVTHFTDAVGEPEPWSAFIFQPDTPEQTHDDYIAEYCGLLDDKGMIATGETEAAAVCALFCGLELRKDPKSTHDVQEIFRKNSSFGHEKN